MIDLSLSGESGLNGRPSRRRKVQSWFLTKFTSFACNALSPAYNLKAWSQAFIRSQHDCQFKERRFSVTGTQFLNCIHFHNCIIFYVQSHAPHPSLFYLSLHRAIIRNNLISFQFDLVFWFVVTCTSNPIHIHHWIKKHSINFCWQTFYLDWQMIATMDCLWRFV